jgi:hypothetical protein
MIQAEQRFGNARVRIEHAPRGLCGDFSHAGSAAFQTHVKTRG